MSSRTVTTTASGVIIDFEDPSSLVVVEDDIFYAHSNICRYNGTRKVMLLEHDALVTLLAMRVYRDPRLIGLIAMHDFVEYIVGDVVTGLKALLPGYAAIEQAFERRLWDHFGYVLPTEYEAGCIRDIDHEALVIETRATHHPIAQRVRERYGVPDAGAQELFNVVRGMSPAQQWEVTLRAVRMGACS